MSAPFGGNGKPRLPLQTSAPDLLMHMHAGRYSQLLTTSPILKLFLSRLDDLVAMDPRTPKAR
jgi:hypothetical protein